MPKKKLEPGVAETIADCFYVYNDKDDFVQFYSASEHGSDALKKAQEHAEAIGGSVK
jgi:hypothetical protein